MKTKICTLLFALSLFVFSGCSDYLDKTPALNLVDEDIYSSAERMDGAVMGVYTEMKDNQFIGSKAYVCIENIGDDMINISGNFYEALSSYEMSVGLETQDNYETWEGAYQTINSANTVLANVESHSAVAGVKYKQYVAELKFCRALSYYYLSMLYAQPYKLDAAAKAVPLRLLAESGLENNDLKRSTASEVYAQILDDTDDYADLPSGGATYDKITRATQGAVLMLRMRVYMAMNKWDEAIKAGEAVAGYSLTAGSADPFKSSSSCPESIFSFPMSTTNTAGMQAAVPYFFYKGTSLVVDNTSGIHSPLYPNYNLKADARISSLQASANGYIISTKFTDGQTYLDWVPVFRYAETLLNLAECYANSSNEAKARTALEQVRHRSISASDDPLNISSLTGDALKNAIYLERRSEFIGEAIRAIDIHRRAENFVKRKSTSSEFTVTPTTNGYIWPIPTVERANNKAIED